MATSLSDSLYKSTVRIVCNNGSVGTGFFYLLLGNDNDIRIPFLVTNKHVIEGATTVKIYVHTINTKTKKENKHQEITITDLSKNFIPHPDSNIDLCAAPFGQMIDRMVNENNLWMDIAPFFSSNTYENSIHKNDLSALEEVYMTGYPNGLWDEVNNNSITRKGITASNIKSDWKGKKEFLIDMACFHGSSGSPVYVYNNGAFKANGKLVSGERLIFLGILSSGPLLTAAGDIKIINVPTVQKAITTTQLTMNLGIVIKAEKLDYLKDHFAQYLG
ncbi:MAG: serine protease [Rouxiella badensis]|uniref:S1 family peptidase n=1 Tax=Rouxiella badensis TaxID=1646377 RepID=UPI003C3E9DC8